MSWAMEAYANGEITAEEAENATKNGALIMQHVRGTSAEPAWRPAPEGPPPLQRESHVEVRRWCKDHPGAWAVIEAVHTNVVQRFKRDHFDAVGRNTRQDGGSKRCDVWVRWPA